MRRLIATAWGWTGGEAGAATVRCQVAMAWGGSGGEAETAAKQRRREMGCFLVHAAEAVREENRSDVETWRDDANKLKEAPAALIVRQPNGSACHDVYSRRIVTMRPPGQIRQPNALYISSI